MPISLVRKYKVVFIVACLLISSFSFAQSPTIKTTPYKNNILIGEQLKLKVEASFQPDVYKVHWLSVPDTMPHFEVIDRSKIDSSFTADNKLTGLSQIITLTSFDSGQWHIPAFPINFDPVVDDKTLYLYTDSVSVGVFYMPSDSTTQLRDIKPIREVPAESFFWYWVIGIVLVLLLIAIIVWIILNKKKRTTVANTASAYKEAMDAIEELDNYDLTDLRQTKQFHSKLAEIFKLYLSHKQNRNRLNQTTDEVLISLKEEQLDGELFSNLAAALRCGDAVKFAKYHPSVNISKDSLLSVKRSIESLNQQRAF
jgi:uncharacterized protein DUF4381